MQIKVDDEIILELSEDDIKILAHDLPSKEIRDDIIRRLKYIVEHKIGRVAERIRTSYLPIIEADPTIESIPKTTKGLASLILQKEYYKDRDKRDEEEAAREKILNPIKEPVRPIDDIMPVVEDGK